MIQGDKSNMLVSEVGDVLFGCTNDPLRFVLAMFPWGEGDLKKHDGPDSWQLDILTHIRDELAQGHGPIKIAVASGHGIGKSALISWLMLWSLMTISGSRSVVTANTENQLRTKTWAELSKWFNICLARKFFSLTATAVFSAKKTEEKTWRLDMVPWSERNTEAFAGMHNEGKRVALFFDEASAIPARVWEVAEGALTDQNTQILWCVFGNPTQVTGRFHSCFHDSAHRWVQRQVDSRTCRFTNKEQIAQWVEDYGEDSDFVRVRVRGIFPRTGSNQFISQGHIDDAVRRTNEVITGSPKIMGVDIARFGDDRTVIARRHGRKLETLDKFSGLNTMEVAAVVAKAINDYSPDMVFLDEIGVGGGVIDRLRQLGYTVVGVQAGAKPDPENAHIYVNKRIEMWDRMREWLRTADIPKDDDLIADLAGPEYFYTTTSKMQLESKDDMKRRGVASPDSGDALAMTFAHVVTPSTLTKAQLHYETLPTY
jgi:hypothetical protein